MDRNQGTIKEISKKTLANSAYAVSTKALNDVINALSKCGANRIFDLPKIAVIGKQSAGKSSLLESISKIKLPRSFGTCTRCPMEFILRSGTDTPWRCKVSLRYNEEVEGKRNDFEFSVIEENQRDEVEMILRQAQLALLSPTENVKSFLTKTRKECEEAAAKLVQPFTKNSILVEIYGADVDVTFIDLPGLIGDVKPYDIQ
jgi:GTPase SAR1 family protein